MGTEPGESCDPDPSRESPRRYFAPSLSILNLRVQSDASRPPPTLHSSASAANGDGGGLSTDWGRIYTDEDVVSYYDKTPAPILSSKASPISAPPRLRAKCPNPTIPGGERLDREAIRLSLQFRYVDP